MSLMTQTAGAVRAKPWPSHTARGSGRAPAKPDTYCVVMLVTGKATIWIEYAVTPEEPV